MTVEEFSNEFDVLLNSYSSMDNNVSINLDEYEKSVFLTKAQNDIVLETYGSDITGKSFEIDEKTRRYLGNLVKNYETTQLVYGNSSISENSYFFKLPEDLWFIVYESVNLLDPKLGCKSRNNITVTPITQDEYHRVKLNPFRGANERRVLRLDTNKGMVELISKYIIEKYTMNYLAKPNPIILTDLPDDLSIEGKNKITQCELNSAIHKTILDRAVRLAILSKIKSTDNNV